MMHSGTKLLRYVQLLDSALPIGGFSHSFGLEAYTHDGRIRTTAKLEQFIRGQLHSSLVRLDGLAIKGVYQAIEQQDAALLALYDKRVHAQRTPGNCGKVDTRWGSDYSNLRDHFTHGWTFL